MEPGGATSGGAPSAETMVNPELEAGNPPEEPAPPPAAAAVGFAGRANAAAASAFEEFGRRVARNPGKPIAGSIIATMLMGIGIATSFHEENRSEKLWVPDNSKAQDDKAYVDSYYPYENRFALYYFSRRDGGDVLTPEAFDVLYDSYVEGVASVVVNGTVDGEVYTYSHLCYRPGGSRTSCVARTLFQFFGTNASAWSTKEKILAVVNQPELRNANGEREDVESILAGIVRDANGDIASATIVSNTYLIFNNRTAKDGNWVDEIGDAWEKGFLDKMEYYHKTWAEYDVSYAATRSFSDEFGDAIEGDLVLLQGAIFTAVAFAVVQLSRWKLGWVGNRTWLAVVGILSVGLAIVSCYGLVSAFGLFYSPLMGVLPFLMLGIGVDDMFILVDAVDLTDVNLPVEERVAKTMGTAGLSILLTTTTDFCALLIGSITSLPALSKFCVFAAFGVAFDFIYQVTFFLAFLAIDLRRMHKDRGACACCDCCELNCKCCVYEKTGRVVNTPNLVPHPRMHAVMRKLGRVLGQRPVQIAVVVAFLGLLAGGIYGSAQVEVEGSVTKFIPSGSYLWDFYEDEEQFSKAGGLSCDVYFRDVDFTSPDTWQDFADAHTVLLSNPYVAPTSVNSFMEALQASAILQSNTYNQQLYDFLQTRPGNTYNQQLYDFLQTKPGARFKNDIVWYNEADPSEGVRTARIRARHVYLSGTKEMISAMDSLRSDLGGVQSDEYLFAYGYTYIQTEQYKRIDDEAVLCISLALTIMCVVIFSFVINPVASSLIFVILCMIIVNILGYSYYWNLMLDSVTVIMLVVALGLSVDYATHVGRAYMETNGTPAERLEATLGEVGTAVLNGATSTFLAVLWLSNSESYVFVTFFKQLALCTVFGMLHGILLLPVALAMLNPAPFRTKAQ